MTRALGEDLDLAGRCYLDLFQGRNTDEAEAAAQHFATVVELVRKNLSQ